MPRGQKSKVGATRIAPNGYHYTNTKLGWVLTHRLVVEKHLGRSLLPNERVTFVDGDRTNRNIDNLKVSVIREGTLAKRKARIEARIEELQAELADLQ